MFTGVHRTPPMSGGGNSGMRFPRIAQTGNLSATRLTHISLQVEVISSHVWMGNVRDTA